MKRILLVWARQVAIGLGKPRVCKHVRKAGSVYIVVYARRKDEKGFFNISVATRCPMPNAKNSLQRFLYDDESKNDGTQLAYID
eukprot:COSAG02_NODE_20012_length_852_cov_1.257636_1_plen_83_part_10